MRANKLPKEVELLYRLCVPRIPVSLLCSAMVLLATAGLAQITTLTGQTSGGAHYRIAVPDGWAPPDGLVIWNHGFSLAPIGPVSEAGLGPLAGLQLSEGYAVAASSYSLTGWALFETVADNREMVDAFEDEFGVPDQILLTGGSLGGIVTAQGVEVGRLGNVVGAMPICGALAGSRVWDGWVFYGSLTNVEFEMTVTDTQTGLEKVYYNPPGTMASVGDTGAF